MRLCYRRRVGVFRLGQGWLVIRAETAGGATRPVVAARCARRSLHQPLVGGDPGTRNRLRGLARRRVHWHGGGLLGQWQAVRDTCWHRPTARVSVPSMACRRQLLRGSARWAGPETASWPDTCGADGGGVSSRTVSARAIASARLGIVTAGPAGLERAVPMDRAGPPRLSCVAAAPGDCPCWACRQCRRRCWPPPSRPRRRATQPSSRPAAALGAVGVEMVGWRTTATCFSAIQLVSGTSRVLESAPCVVPRGQHRSA